MHILSYIVELAVYNKPLNGLRCGTWLIFWDVTSTYLLNQTSGSKYVYKEHITGISANEFRWNFEYFPVMKDESNFANSIWRFSNFSIMTIYVKAPYLLLLHQIRRHIHYQNWNGKQTKAVFASNSILIFIISNKELTSNIS